ncbi:uncharacterized protein N7496_003666 [Penicillium cataractarum]|uniref:Uncharacterized protein n=1 Tax=Penicillium cataractarum TaxID=2100454 RepID=A0A9W9SRP2_9EURO|nr:uncharacterized protein N7496_003666 [Penicillium cataractarum]KAJ5381238.1 hypothetical protein N7496_003666 [Penicillium cataractarum]
MVSTIDNNPLVPNSMQTRKSLDDNGQSAGQAHRLNDLQMIIDRNVAPSPQSMCAELAHDHALEDLHKITEHTSEPSDPVRDKDPFFTVNYADHATQSVPRRPDE